MKEGVYVIKTPIGVSQTANLLQSLANRRCSLIRAFREIRRCQLCVTEWCLYVPAPEMDDKLFAYWEDGVRTGCECDGGHDERMQSTEIALFSSPARAKRRRL